MKLLHPPLTRIESRWFKPSDGLLWRIAKNDSSVSPDLVKAVNQDPESMQFVEELRYVEPVGVPDNLSNVELPQVLFQWLDRVEAVRQKNFSTTPKCGQLVKIITVTGPEGEIPTDLAQPVVVLLDTPSEADQVWHGWLVGSEADYATYWDYVLQEEDGVFDPIAAMVQLWNPVSVYLPSLDSVIGEIRLERMQAIHALAAEYLTADSLNQADARPGVIGLRSTLHGFSIVTGTPLSGPNDPRWHYQEIYHKVAEVAVLKAAKLAVQMAEAPWWESLLDVIQVYAEDFSLSWETPTPLYAMSDSEQTKPNITRIIDKHVLFRPDDKRIDVLFLANVSGKKLTALTRNAGQEMLNKILLPADGVEKELSLTGATFLEVQDEIGQVLYLLPLSEDEESWEE